MDNHSVTDETKISKIHSNLKRKAPSSLVSPDKPKRFKSDDTFIVPLPPSDKSPKKLKRSKSSNSFVIPSPSPSVKSSGKRKRLSSCDSSSQVSSVLSLTNSVAYGAPEDSDEFDLDDDMISQTESEKPVHQFMKLDTSQLNRKYGVLFSEDLTDDYEVWTLQCSNDIDVKEMHEQFINFKDVSTLKINNTLSSKVDLIPYKSLEDTTISIVVPSEETSNLSLKVVPLSGTLIMSNRVKKENPTNQTLLPVDTIEDATKRRSDLMSRITKRLSNKYDIDSTQKTTVKKEFLHKSPKKVNQKSKHKLTN